MKISIITASYNYAQYIEETIDSVINQSHTDWELIIVDDGSFDNSVEIIKSYCKKDSRIKMFQHPDGQNKGLKESLLLGLKNATGKWVGFLESDDVFEPDNLLKKVKIAQKYPDVTLIFNDVEYVYDDKNLQKTANSLIETHKTLSAQVFPRNMRHDFYKDNMILTFSCVMVKSEVIQNTDFNTPNDARLDWWLWVHLAYDNEFYYLDEKLTKWRLHPQSYIRKNKLPRFYLIQMRAYGNVYKNNPNDFKLLLLNCYYKVELIFAYCFRAVRNKIRKIFTN